MKPSDIVKLKIEDLYGPSAITRVKMFMQDVRDCKTSEQDRLTVARNRLEGDFRMDISQACDQGRIKSIEELEEFLIDELVEQGEPDVFFEQLELEEYDGSIAPKAFVNDILMKFRRLKTRFPDHSFPNVDNSIKARLLEALPPYWQRKMSSYNVESYDIQQFVQKFTKRWNAMNEQKEEGVVGAIGRTETENSEKESGMDKLVRSVELMSAQLGQRALNLREPEVKPPRQVREGPKKYCYFCETRTHTTEECWLKPPPHLCYACFGNDHKKGDERCPNLNVPKSRSKVQQI